MRILETHRCDYKIVFISQAGESGTSWVRYLKQDTS
jgi:hypothetical protein